MSTKFTSIISEIGAFEMHLLDMKLTRFLGHYITETNSAEI